MSSPTPSTIDNAILPFHDTQDYPISHIFSQLIEPERGWVSLKFIEYQDEGATGQSGVEKDGQGMKEGTNLAGQMPVCAPVCIPSTSDITDVLCTHNNTKDYCHDCNDDVPLVFIPPPTFAQTILGVLNASQAASEAGIRPLTGYHLSTSSDKEGDSDKENHQDAAKVSSPRQDAQGMGTCQGRGGGQGKDGRRGRGVEEAERGPIHLYHSWQMRSVGTQCSESLTLNEFSCNTQHHYIPFCILNS